MRLVTLVALFAAACASAPNATPPPWTEIPPHIAEAFCARLQGEGISTAGTLAIVNKTEPIATAGAMSALASVYYKPAGNGIGMADMVRSTTSALPVSVAGATSCSWQPIDAVHATDHRDWVVVQFSSPFVNPYAPKESGMFARMSIGGQNAQWYWIPLASRGGVWAIGTIVPMELHEG